MFILLGGGQNFNELSFIISSSCPSAGSCGGMERKLKSGVVVGEG